MRHDTREIHYDVNNIFNGMNWQGVKNKWWREMGTVAKQLYLESNQ